MARNVNWLKINPGMGNSEPEEPPRRPGTHARTRPHPTPGKPAAPVLTNPVPVDFTADVSGKIIDGGPGKNILNRNKYVREDTGTHETLEILDESILEGDEEKTGADPYNTCRFDRSRS